VTDHVRVYVEGGGGAIDFDAPVRSLEARHALSELFRIDLELELDSEDPIGITPMRGIDLDLAALRDHRALVEFGGEGTPHVFHGIVSAAEFLRVRDHRAVYRITLRPELHRLTHHFDTRIFQRLSVPEICAEVIARSGQPIELHLSGDYPALEYVVQHQESDLDFVRRLLEQEGIFFWFAHERARHVMSLADSSAPWRPIDGGVLRFHTEAGPHADEIAELRFTTRVVHDAHVTRDWDWMRPNAPLEGDHSAGARRFERYEYPGRLRDESDARRRARTRHEESEARKYELTGVVRDGRILPGTHFALEGARPAEINLEYAVTGTVHRFAASASHEELVERVELTAIPRTQTFRPPRVTPQPRLSGRESAIVTGPAGEEIHVDELACVKAQFYWDRVGERNEHSSHWMRVAQPNTAGSMYLPRIDWEVAIAHLDGDPDRPLVTHKLFGGANPPPYVLPEGLVYSAWKSQSSPRAEGHNELRFDDTNGGMELYLHAQRDLDTRVGNDRSEAVGINATEEVLGRLNTSVGLTETITVGIDQVKQIERRMRAATGVNKTVTIAQLDGWDVAENHSITNDRDRTESIVGPMVTVANDATVTVNGNSDCVVGGALWTRVSGSYVEAIGQNKEETISGARVILVRGAHREHAGGAKTLSAGEGTHNTAGTYSVTASDIDLSVSGALAHEVAENVGVSGSDVTVRGQSELRARAGGAELVLGGSVLDVDASAFSSSGAIVRLLGQIELIGGDSAEDPAPPEPAPEDDWIEIRLVDTNGEAVSGARYVVRLADGSERSGSTNGSGTAREDGIPPGTVLVSFPGLSPEVEAEE
jgi:type VI secretion system secreted protein VgrG